MEMKQYDIVLVGLDPTVGAEMKKTRPAIVLSPDEMNQSLLTVLVAPLTKGKLAAPTRVDCRFQGAQGQIALDHLRAVSRLRLVKPLGKLPAEGMECLAVLRALFSPPHSAT